MFCFGRCTRTCRLLDDPFFKDEKGLTCNTWGIRVKLGFAGEFVTRGGKTVEQWVTCLDMESNLIGYTPNGLAELADHCMESCRLCKPGRQQKKRTSTTITTTTTTHTTRTVTSTTGEQTTRITHPSWTAQDLQQRTKVGNAEHCYIALFVGERCETPGAVYHVAEAWYHGHKGGKAAIARSCGRVVENWAAKGGHAQYVTNVQFSLDMQGMADYVADIECDHAHPPVNYDFKDTTTTTTTTTTMATSAATTTAAATKARAPVPPVEKSCADLNPQCGDWAIQGLCYDPSYTASMAWECRTSCGIDGCGTPPATVARAAQTFAPFGADQPPADPPTTFLTVTAALGEHACAAQSDAEKTRNLVAVADKTGQSQYFDLSKSVWECSGDKLEVKFALKPGIAGADQDALTHAVAQLKRQAEVQFAETSGAALTLESGGQRLVVTDLSAQAGGVTTTALSDAGGDGGGGDGPDSTGAVVGTVLAVLFILVLGAAVAAWWYKKRQDAAVWSSLRDESRRAALAATGGTVAAARHHLHAHAEDVCMFAIPFADDEHPATAQGMLRSKKNKMHEYLQVLPASSPTANTVQSGGTDAQHVAT